MKIYGNTKRPWVILASAVHNLPLYLKARGLAILNHLSSVSGTELSMAGLLLVRPYPRV